MLLTKLRFVPSDGRSCVAVQNWLLENDNIRNGCRRKEFGKFSKPGRVRSYTQDRLEQVETLQEG
jgi:hypothetical protein